MLKYVVKTKAGKYVSGATTKYSERDFQKLVDNFEDADLFSKEDLEEDFGIISCLTPEWLGLEDEFLIVEIVLVNK
jgi:hypothetical protein